MREHRSYTAKAISKLYCIICLINIGKSSRNHARKGSPLAVCSLRSAVTGSLVMLIEYRWSGMHRLQLSRVPERYVKCPGRVLTYVLRRENRKGSVAIVSTRCCE